MEYICALETETDTERQKGGKRLAGARVPSKGSRGTASGLMGEDVEL